MDYVLVANAMVYRKKWRAFFMDVCSFKKADEEALEIIKQRRLALINKYGVLMDTTKYESIFVRAGKAGAIYWKERWVPKLTRKGVLNPEAFNALFDSLLELFCLEEYWKACEKTGFLRPDF